MNFKYSVIGDNSQENREWLEKVGITHNHFDTDIEKNHHLICNYGMYISIDLTTVFDLDMFEDIYKEDINCIGNPQLFQAVSAIRENSDYMQWFVFKSQYSHKSEYWFMCTGSNYVQWAKKQKPFLNILVLAHKATLSELINHFK